MRALQYALVVFVQAVLVVAVIAGIKTVTHLDQAGALSPDGVSSVHAPHAP